MEQGFSARLGKKLPSWWFRGGKWDVVLLDIEHYETGGSATILEDFAELVDERIWVCINRDGRYHGVFEDQFYAPSSNELHPTVKDIYYPFDDEPHLYLKFASLGKATWDCLGGHYLSEHKLEGEDNEEFLPIKLKDKIVEFHVSYGPPSFWQNYTHRSSKHVTTVHFMLRQAQLIDTVLQYQRFLTGESTIDGLRKRILAIRNSEQREIDLQNIVDEKEWELRKRMIKAASEKFFDPCWAKYLGDYTPDQTKFEGYDLSTDVGVIKAVEKAIRDESVKGHAIGGLMLEVNTVPSISDGSVSPWEFTFQFTDLLNVIWYQAFQAVMRGVLLKNCRNEQCDKPQRLFVADRPNQVYCGTRCRNYHNVQAWRNRRRQLKSKGDLLP